MRGWRRRAVEAEALIERVKDRTFHWTDPGQPPQLQWAGHKVWDMLDDDHHEAPQPQARLTVYMADVSDMTRRHQIIEQVAQMEDTLGLTVRCSFRQADRGVTA